MLLLFLFTTVDTVLAPVVTQTVMGLETLWTRRKAGSHFAAVLYELTILHIGTWQEHKGMKAHPDIMIRVCALLVTHQEGILIRPWESNGRREGAQEASPAIGKDTRLAAQQAPPR